MLSLCCLMNKLSASQTTAVRMFFKTEHRIAVICLNPVNNFHKLASNYTRTVSERVVRFRKQIVGDFQNYFLAVDEVRVSPTCKQALLVFIIQNFSIKLVKYIGHFLLNFSRLGRDHRKADLPPS